MSDSERPTDADLISAFHAGDRDAFAGIYDRYAGRVFSRLLEAGLERAEAVESTHDTFIEAAGMLEQSEEPVDLQSWLMGISADVAGLPDHVMEQSPSEEVSPPPALRARVLSKTDRGVVTPVSVSPTKPQVPQEWINIGMLALVALVVGLIGLGVSAQFEPLAPPPTTPGVENPTATVEESTSTSATVPSSSTSTQPAQSTTSTTTAAAPAALEVSTDTIDLGTDADPGEFDITNTGGEDAAWEVSSSTGAIVLSAAEGELAGGETVAIELNLDREGIEEGDLAETLTVTWSGDDIEIAVVGSHEANPIIHNPQATPSSVEVSGDSECTNTQTTVSARIRDASPLESVVVRWSPDGSDEQETEMNPVGNDMFEGVVGPFLTEQTASVRIVAFDDRGNAGGASASVSVVACP